MREEVIFGHSATLLLITIVGILQPQFQQILLGRMAIQHRSRQHLLAFAVHPLATCSMQITDLANQAILGEGAPHLSADREIGLTAATERANRVTMVIEEGTGKSNFKIGPFELSKIIPQTDRGLQIGVPHPITDRLHSRGQCHPITTQRPMCVAYIPLQDVSPEVFPGRTSQLGPKASGRLLDAKLVFDLGITTLMVQIAQRIARVRMLG